MANLLRFIDVQQASRAADEVAVGGFLDLGWCELARRKAQVRSLLF
jgi:hypothetical protein